MFVSDLKVGMPIDITASVGLDKLEFKTVAVDITDKKDQAVLHKLESSFRGCVSRPIQLIRTEAGQPLQLYSPNVVCSAFGIIENAPFLWPGVKVVKVNFPNAGLLHVIFSEKNVKAVNRRQSYRQWVGERGIARIGLNKNTAEIVVKDISTTGIGIIFPRDFEPAEGDVIHVNFSDVLKDLKNNSEQQVVLNLNAKVLRTIELDDGRHFTGCKFVEKYKAVADYISSKQRINLSNKSRQGLMNKG